MQKTGADSLAPIIEDLNIDDDRSEEEVWSMITMCVMYINIYNFRLLKKNPVKIRYVMVTSYSIVY